MLHCNHLVRTLTSERTMCRRADSTPVPSVSGVAMSVAASRRRSMERAASQRPGSRPTSRQNSLEEPLFAPGAREAEQGGQQGVIADGDFIPMEHYSQRAQWLRAGALSLRYAPACASCAETWGVPCRI